MLFTEIDDAHVILCRGGVFQQAAVCQRGDRLYAKVGNGKYIGLRRERGTTDPKVWWDFIDLGHDFERVTGAMIVGRIDRAVAPARRTPTNRKTSSLTREFA